MQELKIGDIVRCITDKRHRDYPEFYPVKGTIGKVVNAQGGLEIQWEKGSTSLNDCWLFESFNVEKIILGEE